jgi:hypothetical protein
MQHGYVLAGKGGLAVPEIKNVVSFESRVETPDETRHAGA